ncbi:glycosyl hydrolase family 18 protein [Morganella morganii]
MSINDSIRTQSNSSGVSASGIPDIRNKKIVMGFWHNWLQDEYSGSGYKQGYFRNLSLSEIPEDYNVIAVAFMKVPEGSTDRIPTFIPYTGNDKEFRNQVSALNAQGRIVLISMGGADAHIALQKGDEEALAQQIIQLVEIYGFNGLDIDLEQAAITAKDNQIVIPAALKKVKDHYRVQGKNFIISMAPEFPYLRSGNSYSPYITSLEGYYDFIAPQFYNQGGDGIWIDNIGNLQQNNDEMKEDFLYYLTESIVTGTRGYIKIPPEKFVIGLPSNNDGAANGYVINPDNVKQALIRLENAGLAIKGLMTWSINWDDGIAKNGEKYNWEFIRRYGYVSEGERPAPEKPFVPKGLEETSHTADSITLNWQPSGGSYPIKNYTLYRDGIAIPPVVSPPYTDNNLQPNKEYSYQIQANDTQGNSSGLSVAITARTGSGMTAEWLEGVWYPDNAMVSYLGNTYRCVMQHTSNKFWTPDIATSLWTSL